MSQPLPSPTPPTGPAAFIHRVLRTGVTDPAGDHARDAARRFLGIDPGIVRHTQVFTVLHTLGAEELRVVAVDEHSLRHVQLRFGRDRQTTAAKVGEVFGPIRQALLPNLPILRARTKKLGQAFLSDKCMGRAPPAAFGLDEQLPNLLRKSPAKIHTPLGW